MKKSKKLKTPERYSTGTVRYSEVDGWSIELDNALWDQKDKDVWITTQAKWVE